MTLQDSALGFEHDSVSLGAGTADLLAEATVSEKLKRECCLQGTNSSDWPASQCTAAAHLLMGDVTWQ
jgi:hypothetical protein